MGKLKQVDAVYEFNKEGYGWSETVITDESVLAVLEMRYGKVQQQLWYIYRTTKKLPATQYSGAYV